MLHTGSIDSEGGRATILACGIEPRGRHFEICVCEPAEVIAEGLHPYFEDYLAETTRPSYYYSE